MTIHPCLWPFVYPSLRRDPNNVATNTPPLQSDNRSGLTLLPAADPSPPRLPHDPARCGGID